MHIWTYISTQCWLYVCIHGRVFRCTHGVNMNERKNDTDMQPLGSLIAFWSNVIVRCVRFFLAWLACWCIASLLVGPFFGWLCLLFSCLLPSFARLARCARLLVLACFVGCAVLFLLFLHCFVLFCSVMFRLVLYCLLLPCNVVYCTVLYGIALFCILLFWSVRFFLYSVVSLVACLLMRLLACLLSYFLACFLPLLASLLSFLPRFFPSFGVLHCKIKREQSRKVQCDDFPRHKVQVGNLNCHMDCTVEAHWLRLNVHLLLIFENLLSSFCNTYKTNRKQQHRSGPPTRVMTRLSGSFAP